jgi:AraC-like DNA-binding protein
MSTPLLVGTLAPLPTRTTGEARATWFRETTPSTHVRAAVASRWHGFGGWDRTLRVLPDGCADVIWDRRELIVVGAHPAPLRFGVAADSHNVGLRLRLGRAGAVLGVSMAELPRGPVPLDDLWGASARRLAQRLHGASTTRGRHELLEQAVADRLDATASASDRTVDAAVRLLRLPGARVDDVARTVGLSPRELRRRFLVHVGYGPKALHRVLRLRAFLRNVPGSASLADCAARSGYADQSHLGRECRQLAGSTPARLLAGLGRNVPDATTGASAR